MEYIFQYPCFPEQSSMIKNDAVALSCMCSLGKLKTDIVNKNKIYVEATITKPITLSFQIYLCTN